MSQAKKEFLGSEEASQLRAELKSMVDDPRYNTQTRYSSLLKGKTDFVQANMDYLSNYPQVNRSQYILNLKLRTKKSSR